MSILTNAFSGTVQVIKELEPTEYNRRFIVSLPGNNPESAKFSGNFFMEVFNKTAERAGVVAGQVIDVVGRFSVNYNSEKKETSVNLNVDNIIPNRAIQMDYAADINVVFPTNVAVVTGITSNVKTGTTANGNAYTSFSVKAPALYAKAGEAVTGRQFINVTYWGTLDIADNQYIQVVGSLASRYDGEAKKSYFNINAEVVKGIRPIELREIKEQSAPAAPSAPGSAPSAPAPSTPAAPSAPATPDFSRQESPFSNSSPLEIDDDDLPF